MTTEKKKEEKPADEIKVETYRKEFEELPLEKKVASLLELEAITLSETVSFVINSPSMIVGKFMDVLAEFGLKMEDDAKKATRPNEHNGNGKAQETAATENVKTTADETEEIVDAQPKHEETESKYEN